VVRGAARRSPDAPKIVTWPVGTALWRVSLDPAGTAFSVSTRRRHRFSPVTAGDGSVVPSWYGATSAAGAIFESVFHDIRPSHRAPRVMPNQYLDRILAPVLTSRPLALVDLTTDGLHAIGITRSALIESTSRSYAWTVGIAERLRAAAPDVDGFAWVSRARDTSLSVVLYADAGRAPMIAPAPATPLPLGVGAGLRLLRELATAARITLIVPDQ
jgi:hypothetical protein